VWAELFTITYNDSICAVETAARRCKKRMCYREETGVNNVTCNSRVFLRPDLCTTFKFQANIPAQELHMQTFSPRSDLQAVEKVMLQELLAMRTRMVNNVPKHIQNPRLSKD
jgi:hypothetical protein